MKELLTSFSRFSITMTTMKTKDYSMRDNRELTIDEIEKLQEVRSLLQGLRGMSQLEWIDQMSARFDQQIMSPKQTIASFEEGTAGDSRFFIAIHFFVSSHLINSIFRLSTSDSSSMTSSFEGRGLNQG